MFSYRSRFVHVFNAYAKQSVYVHIEISHQRKWNNKTGIRHTHTLDQTAASLPQRAWGQYFAAFLWPCLKTFSSYCLQYPSHLLISPSCRHVRICEITLTQWKIFLLMIPFFDFHNKPIIIIGMLQRAILYILIQAWLAENTTVRDPPFCSHIHICKARRQIETL